VRVEITNGTSPVVTQIPVDSRFRIGIIRLATTVNNVEALSGVDMVEVQPIHGNVG